MPNYFKFEDRDKYDITLLVNQIINEKMDFDEEGQFIKKQWEGKDGKSIWKEFYNHKMRFFTNDIELEKNKLRFPDNYKIAEAPKVEYKKEKLENFPLYQRPQKEFRIMFEAVYEKWNRENPDKKIEKKDRWKYQIDHINPRNNGGKTILENLRPLLAFENKIKGKKIIDE